jgi:hypothetical protein
MDWFFDFIERAEHWVKYVALILAVAIVGVLMWPVKEYAIDTASIKLPCRTYYSSEANNRYDFHSVLYTEQDCRKESFNYTRMTVYVDHMEWGAPNGGYTSTLHFEIPSEDAKRIFLIKESVQLYHTTEAGAVLHPETFGPSQCRVGAIFKNIYSRKTVEGHQLTEHIAFKLRVDNRIIEVHKDFPLTLAPHYSLWDALMGI